MRADAGGSTADEGGTASLRYEWKVRDFTLTPSLSLSLSLSLTLTLTLSPTPTLTLTLTLTSPLTLTPTLTRPRARARYSVWRYPTRSTRCSSISMRAQAKLSTAPRP